MYPVLSLVTTRPSYLFLLCLCKRLSEVIVYHSKRLNNVYFLFTGKKGLDSFTTIREYKRFHQCH